jgi:pimeloyl-ACP methyl ester carboxylesterase
MSEIARAGDEQIVSANGVDLCLQTFGDRGDPPILLIMGSGASMDWWEDALCARLAAGGRFVVRYDHRDTGRSVTYEPGAPGYTGDDLVGDAVGIIDVLGLAPAHVVGMSMGGAFAQLIALDHRDRVASLTLIATSGGAGDPDLPGMPAQARAAFAAVSAPDWSDRAAVVSYYTQLARVAVSPNRAFDEEGFARLCERVLDRTTNIASSAMNHDLLDGGGRWRERLAGLDVPTLVVHGTDDPVFPHEHGEALAREIPGARLLTLEDTGHELPPATWDVLVPALLEHTARA